MSEIDVVLSALGQSTEPLRSADGATRRYGDAVETAAWVASRETDGSLLSALREFASEVNTRARERAREVAELAQALEECAVRYREDDAAAARGLDGLRFGQVEG